MKHLFIITIEAPYNAPTWKIKELTEKGLNGSPIQGAKITVTKPRNVKY